MFAIICLNIMLLISCWYLIAENQKNKNKINGLQDDLNKAIKRLVALEEGVTQKSWFRRNWFCRVTPAKFIRYLKSFYKANLDINKPLRLWVFINTLLKFRTFGLAHYLFYRPYSSLKYSSSIFRRYYIFLRY